MNILYNSLKSGSPKDHFRQAKVPGTPLIERSEKQALNIQASLM